MVSKSLRRRMQGELFQRFEVGEKPGSLLSLYSANYVWKQYRLWMLKRIANEINFLLLLQEHSHVKTKKLDEFYEHLKFGKL